MAYIEAKHLSKTYDSGGVRCEALKDGNFSIEESSLTVILGPSGAGKTTLLNLLGGMDWITGGSLTVDGCSLEKLSSRQLTAYRRTDVGFIFQFYNLMPNLTARENIELATEICSDAMDCDEALELVGLSDKKNNFPGQLSGGQQQRVAIARAVAKNPKILLCDEPTGALDVETGKIILKLLADLAEKRGKTVIIVTHNGAIRHMAHHILRIRNGQIIEDICNNQVLPVDSIVW